MLEYHIWPLIVILSYQIIWWYIITSFYIISYYHIIILYHIWPLIICSMNGTNSPLPFHLAVPTSEASFQFMIANTIFFLITFSFNVRPIGYRPIPGIFLLLLFLLGPVSDCYSKSLIYHIQTSGSPQPIHFLKAHDVSYPNSDENTNTKTKTVTKTMTKTKTPMEWLKQ